MKITRKKFLQLSGIFAAGTLASPSIWAKQPTKLTGETTADYDVIIIGAGLAGLTTALRLEQMGITNNLIIEAKDRVGGRTLNIPIEGGYIAEGGGQWIGPGQTAIMDLMEELGIESFPHHYDGTTFGADDLPDYAQQDYDNLVQTLDDLAATIDPLAPWDHSNASDWDNITLESWLENNANSIEGFFQIFFEISGFLGSPSNMSLLYFLFYVRSASSYNHLEIHAQEQRIQGGSQRISITLAEQINTPIMLSSPVSSINDTGEEVVVNYGSTSATASKVVVAMMPKDAKNINFESGLTAQRTGLQDNWTASHGVKIHLVYETPFWRDAGHSGTGFGDLLQVVLDNSPEDASSGIMLAFVGDDFMNMPADQREQAAKDELEGQFGTEAQNTIDYVETDWSEQDFTGGCTTQLGTGFLSQYGAALRTPIGNIHWAGTETSDIWTGYMDGAIRSGQRVAEELTSLLVGVSDNFNASHQFSIYPNPATTTFWLENNALENETIELSLIDMSGRQLFEQKIQFNAKHKIEIGVLPKGNYMINLLVNGKNYSLPIALA